MFLEDFARGIGSILSSGDYAIGIVLRAEGVVMNRVVGSCPIRSVLHALALSTLIFGCTFSSESLVLSLIHI